MDLGIAVGGGVEITKMIGIEARFTQSLTADSTNLFAFDISALKNRSIAILVDVH